MKASHYIKKVKESKPFKEFIKEDPKAYLCSLFFVRDFTEKRNETQVDFYSPKKKGIFSFDAEKKIEKAVNKKAETMEHKKFVPKPLSEDTRMDVDEMKSTLQDEMHNREMAYEIEKVLAFLTIIDGKPVWNCTGFLRGLGLLQAHVEDESASVLFMEKKSFFDMIRFTGKQPTNAMQPVQPTQIQTPQQPQSLPTIKIVDENEVPSKKSQAKGKTEVKKK